MSRYPSPIFKGDLKKAAHNHDYVFASPSKNISKISVTTLITCLLICIAIVATIIWYSVTEAKNESKSIFQNQESENTFRNINSENYALEQFKDFVKNDEFENDIIIHQPEVLLPPKEETPDLLIDETNLQNNISDILGNVEINEKLDSKAENDGGKLSLGNILDTLTSVALGSKKIKNNNLSTLNKTDDKNSSFDTVNNPKWENFHEKLGIENVNLSNVDITEGNPNSSSKLPKPSGSILLNILRNRSEDVGDTALNYLNGIVSVSGLINNITFDGFRISMNSSVKNFKTFNVSNDENKNNRSSKLDFDSIKPELISVFKNDANESDSNYSLIFQKILKLIENNFGKQEENYYDQDYVYSENDALHFYHDYERVTWSDYLLEKIQELYDWIITDMNTDNSTVSKGSDYAPLPQILRALNYSIIEGDASILLMKLKDLLFVQNKTEFDSDWNKKMLTNTSSVLSFGLLTLDVLLLRNIQLIAWDNQDVANKEVMKDPDAFAFNALFMDPQKVKQIQDIVKVSSNGNLEENIIRRKSFYGNVHEEELTSGFYKNKNFGEELTNFILSTIRAITNLGHAFKNTRKQLNTNISSTRDAYIKLVKHYNYTQSSKSSDSSDSLSNTTPSEIDCLWTLYCKNLEKATYLEGVYGFLAKINGIGLRLILGELSLEKAFESLVADTLIGSNHFECKKLFPRCDGKFASKMILQEIITRSLH